MTQVSFEYFPPQSIAASFRLRDTAQVLAPFAPRFVSVTYGAGGTTRTLTRDAARALQGPNQRVAAHLTCVGATRDETLQVADDYAADGITDIVALRGDPPKGQGAFTPHPDGFTDSVELIEALAKTGKFTIRVGAYPNTHPEAANQAADIDWLKRKIDAGASEALTQFFFDPEDFLRFRDACAAAGITAPITPGILPIENWNGVKRFAAACGTPIPPQLINAFEKASRDGRCDLLAVAQCSALCDRLRDEGVDRFHFYTMNRPDLTRDVCRALGLPEHRHGLQRVA